MGISITVKFSTKCHYSLPEETEATPLLPV
jgi:hypothetical protein